MINFRFWACPECVHVRALNLGRMVNGCLLIDEGESPVDGAAWEYQDHDICPAFEPRRAKEERAAGVGTP